jgi:uncharacterized protein YodC (DUF2158 family)
MEKRMSNEFKVGDRVRVIVKGDHLGGLEGIITENDGEVVCPWHVCFDDVETSVYDAVELELVAGHSESLEQDLIPG